MNVISIGDFKEIKDLRSREKMYYEYLETLSNAQLEIEINSLLSEFSLDVCGKYFMSKCQLILKEISSRVEPQHKSKIELISQETLKLL